MTRSRLPLSPLLLSAALVALPFGHARAQGDPPDVVALSFTATAAKVLPGGSGEKGRGWNCNGVIAPTDQIGRLAIVSTFYQNGCYLDGSFNHRDFKVEQGFVADASGTGRMEAYRVHGPSHKARRFLGSRHYLFYRFPTRGDYTVYRFEGGSLAKSATVSAAEANPDQFVKLGINASELGGAVVYVIAPTSQRVSALASVGKGVDAARVARTPLGEVFKYRYRVGGVPYDTRTGFNHGPASYANVYSQPRQFFPVTRKSGGLAVVWQDKTSMAVNVTSVADDLKAFTTVSLANPGRFILAAATGDGADCVFYVLVQDGNGASANQARAAALLKADIVRGVIIKQVGLDTSKRGMNITVFGNRNVGSMAYVGGKIGLIIGRTMHRSGDGLNHQGAIGVVFDAATLALLRNHGQTSGHSFESVLGVNKAGEFVGIDLGDNYPRGVHLHKFSDKRRDSAIVYTFKTQHGGRGASPAGRAYPVYPEISRGGKTFYKWSNDNRTYTELGGLVEHGTGYTVVFAGESARGRALDNARVGSYLNDARNVGLVRVRSDFETLKRSGTVVDDALVSSPGPAEQGGFYTFGGHWSAQRNKGVVWLTSYADSKQTNASRVKVAALPGGNLMVMWEKWSANHYVSTYAVKVDASGRKLSPAVELGPKVRLGRRDDLWVRGSDVFAIAGDRVGASLEVVRIRVK